MNYQDLETIPDINLKNPIENPLLDVHRLDLEDESYSVVTLSLEQTFNKLMKTKTSSFKNFFTEGSISIIMFQKSIELFLRIFNQTRREKTSFPIIRVHPNDKWFFNRYIEYDSKEGIQLSRPINPEDSIDFEFKQLLIRRMNRSIFFNILNSNLKQTYDYKKNMVFLIEYFCITKLYHFVKKEINDCERMYDGFNVSFETMCVLYSDECLLNCYDISLPDIIQLIENRFRNICQQEIDMIDQCYPESSKKGHLDPRVFKIDDEDNANNIIFKKKRIYLDKLELKEKKIIKLYKRYIPKSINNVMLFLLEKRSSQGDITLGLLIEIIDIFFTTDIMQHILLEIQSKHLSMNIKSMSSKYTHSQPLNTFNNCFNRFPNKSYTNWDSNHLHNLFVNKFPINKEFSIDFHEITTFKSITQLCRFFNFRQERRIETEQTNNRNIDHELDENLTYSILYNYFSGNLNKGSSSLMSMYKELFSSTFKIFFKKNLKKKFSLYNVRMAILLDMYNPTNDNNMVLENCHDIIEEEKLIVCNSMKNHHKKFSSKSHCILIERIYIGFCLFQDFFSISNHQEKLLDFYLLLLFGIELPNNNKKFDFWNSSHLFFLDIYSIDFEGIFFSQPNLKKIVVDNYVGFLRLLKTIEYEIFDFKNRPDEYNFFEIEHILIKRLHYIYYEKSFLTQLI